MRFFDFQLRHKFVEKIRVSSDAIFQERFVGFAETDLIGHKNVKLLRNGGNIQLPAFRLCAESVQQNDFRFRRVSRFQITNFRTENCYRFFLRRGLREYGKSENKNKQNYDDILFHNYDH